MLFHSPDHLDQLPDRRPASGPIQYRSVSTLVHAILLIQLQTILGKRTLCSDSLSVLIEQLGDDAEQRTQSGYNRHGNIGTQGLKHAWCKQGESRRQDGTQQGHGREAARGVAEVAIGHVPNEDGIELVVGVADQDQGQGGHDPGHTRHARRNGPGEPPRANGEGGRADGEAEQLVLGREQAALALAARHDAVVEEARQHAEDDAQTDGQEGQRGGFRGEAEVLVHRRQRDGEEVDDGGGDGADHGYHEDDGLGEQ